LLKRQYYKSKGCVEILNAELAKDWPNKNALTPLVNDSRKSALPCRRAGPNQMRGGPALRGGQHIWLLIFLVLFVSRQKNVMSICNGLFFQSYYYRNISSPYWDTPW
jgi:hypothetical protein